MDKIHKQVYKTLLECSDLQKYDKYDPCLKYLNILKFHQEIVEFKLNVKDNLNLLKKYQNIYNGLSNYTKKYTGIIPAPKSDMFNILNCPNCKTKLRAPKDKNNLSIKCPNCKYKFKVNTLPSIEKKSHDIKKLNKLLR